ncbi:MAG UNVERIFIED_CONTAM: hypothetical protein LVR18_47445 [Planctomycetaceae bacterium]|jgi:hypothetical protein
MNTSITPRETFGKPTRLSDRRLGCELDTHLQGPRLDSLSKSRRNLEAPFDAPADDSDTETQGTDRNSAGTGIHPQRAAFANCAAQATIAFEGRSFHCSLDDVSGLPLHAELETLASEEQRHEAWQSLLRLAKRLNLQQQERRSDLELVLTSNRDDSAPATT